MTETVQPFEADVSRVLDLVINSLYKDREIFLRELISNASDACDKLRYNSLTKPELLEGDTEFKIELSGDPDGGLLTIRDNGIGMDRDDLVAHLGTIARSGTTRFLEQMESGKEIDLNLIGQFGVGFYSVFMVADKVVVHSRKAGDTTGWLWASDGRSGFSVDESDETLPRGTAITLHLKDESKDFISEWRVREIVRRYSDHIAFPITLHLKPKAGDTKVEDKGPQQINEANALWARPKSEITEEQYKEFYHHVAHAFDDPFARVHFTAEGVLSYSALLFVPSSRPMDLFDPKRTHGVKLYVRRVFITGDLEELMPRYLRFVSGVVDSEDLQLNVSRETLQHGAVIAKIKKTIVKRLLDEIGKQANKKPDATETATEEDGEKVKGPDYETFWVEFGAVLKEGLYEDYENRDAILKLARFRTTHGKGWSSLEQYIERMKEGQEQIFYITGDSIDSLRKSPQLEVATAKGVEVILLEDPVDEFWVPEVGEFKGKKLISLTKSDADLSGIAGDEKSDDKKDDEPTEDLDRLIAKIKLTLGEQVKDVRPSKRLRESAVCLVSDQEQGMDLRMERFLKQHNQLDQLSKRVLEINGDHALIKCMRGMASDDSKAHDIEEMAWLLLDQARIIEGEPIPDPGAFSRRMSGYLAKSLVT